MLNLFSLIRRLSALMLILCLSIMLSGCRGTPLFKVKPRVDLPVDQLTRNTSNDSVELRAQLLNEDESNDLFGGNLILAGVIPVRVAIINHGQQPVATRNISFQLVDNASRRFSALKSKDAFTRMVKYYGIRFYNPILYNEVKERFNSHAIMLADSLAAGETTQGVLYFKQEKESPIPSALQLQLKIKAPAQQLQLSLN